ncbi:TetR family transcriptional regulator [Streptacidiphilus sp. ASG 303]|uniref:TetR family transcriptional regulator n=1 Tax=Streptacidiphilus sp. ASG 303 TaxID=2896847 RepID=UPI001E64751A|nr:TetR family transcriptional regulator [Streptacidiphilus sp. ASG 303]MCD0482529.1 TetR family transcriptional regulator [Streptacidiphilus sp. ASG 303]
MTAGPTPHAEPAAHAGPAARTGPAGHARRAAPGRARTAGAGASHPAGTGGAPLTGRQEERRRRILEAAAALACRGGFDAVQMREVAEGSGVALGTLYRYFPSKTHLLVAVMEDRLQLMRDRLRRRPPAGDDPAARVADVLMRAFHRLQREPRLAEAMVRALTSADRSAGAEADRVGRLTTAVVVDAMGLDRPPTAGELAAVRVVGHTWQSALVSWLSGRSSIAEVRGDLETAARLLTLG